MTAVPIRELNQNTSAVVARVEAGERLDVTRNGVVVARLEPVAPHPLAAMIAAGLVRPALRTLTLPTEAELRGAAADSAGADAVLEDRADPNRG